MPKNIPAKMPIYQLCERIAIKAVTKKQANKTSETNFDFLATLSGISFNFSLTCRFKVL